MSDRASGIIPGSSLAPMIVWVLPDAVCPYAKSVATRQENCAIAFTTTRHKLIYSASLSWLTIEALQKGIDYWPPNFFIYVHVVGSSIEDVIYSERAVPLLVT